MVAWEKRDYNAMKRLVLNAPADFGQRYEQVVRDLQATGLSVRLREVIRAKDTARAPFTARWELKGLGSYSYNGALNLELRNGKWKVAWSPKAIHPDLVQEARFRRSRIWPPRAIIAAADGRSLTEQRPVIVVGIQPGSMKDRAATVRALVDNLGSDPARINAALDQPGVKPDWFVPVEEISVERYQSVKPAIYPVPGLIFRSQEQRSPPTPEFARQVIGTVGEVTGELLRKLGAPYQAGDRVGLTGLEAAFEKRLAGTPSQELAMVDPAGKPLRSLKKVAGRPGQPVRTTLSIPAQNAAEAAVAGVNQPAAIVVVDSATSEVKAAVSRPLGEFNRAFAGRYPPGSSFKIITSYALLTNGRPPERPVSCPQTILAGGRSFRNFEGESLGQISFRQALVRSCNTAFIAMTSELSNDTLSSAASAFGFGRQYAGFPLSAAGGSFPVPKDAAEKAAESIGQGRVLVSPLHMATVAAAVAGSAWRSPRIVSDQAPSEVFVLDGSAIQSLRSMMVSVVAEGTGVRARVPGRQVAGKTGTAEFGSAIPPRTHAWFAGFSGPYAFAVIVEGGGVGGEVAAPIAAKLVAGL